MIPVDEARRLVLASCGALPPTRLDTGAAAGHVLSEAIRATEAVPPFTNSAKDGYAVRAADTARPPARLRVVGSLMAGDRPSFVLSPGEAARIMTGAPLPGGADGVCMVEYTRLEDGGSTVVLDTAVDVGAEVRKAGEDIAAGGDVFAPGTVLRPAHVGVLSSLGIESVLVHRRPVVGVLSTGDEIAPAGAALVPGQIRDANRPALLAQLRADGFDPLDLGLVGDDESLFAQVLDEAVGTCDAVVASGGVSVGDRDVVRLVFEKLVGAATHWMQVAVKPAKPFAFAVHTDPSSLLFGLPGNPVSALVSYELFVRPALRLMAGHRVLERPRLRAVAEERLARRPDGKLHLLRVAGGTDERGSLRVRPSGGQDSHMLLAMAQANGLALVPDGDGIAAGEDVEVMLLDDDGLASAAEPW
jgi:molybdenum cofactor synthesis domain-containing protein